MAHHRYGKNIGHACFRYLYFNKHRIVQHHELAGFLWPTRELSGPALNTNMTTMIKRVMKRLAADNTPWTVISIREEGYQLVPVEFMLQDPVMPSRFTHGASEDYTQDAPDLSPHVQATAPRRGVPVPDPAVHDDTESR